MRVLFLTNIPSPYRVAFFNELGKLCDLTVIFEKKASDERDVSWKYYEFNNFKGIFLNGFAVSVDTAICPTVFKHIKKNKFDKIICCNFSSPTGILAILKMRLKKMPYFLEADGGMAKSGKGIKEKIKKIIVSGAAGYLSTSESCDDYFISYGAQKDRIHRYPFTSLMKADVLNMPLTSFEKDQIRQQLSLKEKHIIISVGRFSYMNGYGKGYDTLLRVCEQLPDDIGIYIIGDEPTEEFKKQKSEKHLDHLHFLPFKLKDELFKYYKAADLSVLLSRGEAWGLVINESMANGTPVIATDACVGALELLKNGINGYIVGVDDSESVLKNIKLFLNFDEKQKKMSAAALDTIKEYTVENMAEAHIKVFNSL